MTENCYLSNTLHRCTGDGTRELNSRVKIVVFAHKRPVERLCLDIEDVTLYEMSDVQPLSPQLRLVQASPPLTPVSAAVVSTVVAIWGPDLFTTAAGRRLVHVIAADGPIAAAERIAMGLLDEDRHDARWHRTVDALKALVALHPTVFLRSASIALQRFTGGPNSEL
ncbi:hypothetical protein QYH69_21695 [Paraburkholderia sp. SARCC-3016]|uniref:hypothetical protein n=1 Tax=Paraburkholderia sp. SARCC-3016 TaxID=3058611 RepID=UPI00280838FB|nr:hypothetical protein [Paraburkholderia sp. SARCC-3016]MDQ7979857.1 hypothetical protein [Paraburkholderia sp. SARCC-3016]